MSESKTFDKLRRIPFLEMRQKLDEQVLPCSVMNLGNIIHEISCLHVDLIKFHMRNKLLIESGWTYEEFVFELEKSAIVHLVGEYNTRCLSHTKELIDRAKIYYPQAKIISARIELE